MVTLISVYFEYIKILVTYLIIYIFKMRMKAKIYGLKFLVVSQLQLKMFSHKWFAIKKFIPYVLAFILILKSI
jgi:hypothetical protein